MDTKMPGRENVVASRCGWNTSSKAQLLETIPSATTRGGWTFKCWLDYEGSFLMGGLMLVWIVIVELVPAESVSLDLSLLSEAHAQSFGLLLSSYKTGVFPHWSSDSKAKTD